MKNITLILVLLFATLSCPAQTHITDPNADKFAGTWKWGDTNNGLTLIMKKENNTQPFKNNPNTLLDSLIGFHKIYKNGQITEDSTPYSNTNFTDRKQTFVGGSHNDDPNILFLFMTHKHKGIKLSIDYLDANHIKIVKVQNQEGIRIKSPGKPPYDSSIDIPVNIVLTKQ